jgi:hypothetical protein
MEVVYSPTKSGNAIPSSRLVDSKPRKRRQERVDNLSSNTYVYVQSTAFRAVAALVGRFLHGF